MPDLLAHERRTYDAMWAVPAYSEYAPGAGFLSIFRAMTGAKPGDTVLDAGCGSGKGALALRDAGFSVRACDLTDAGLVDEASDIPFSHACLWQDLRGQLPYLIGGKVDWVYCCDVLEHIPTPFAMLVISRLLDIGRRGVFLSISLQPDIFGAWVGTPLHQTVQSFPAWRDQLASLATVVEARDLLNAGVYLVRA
jgi:2-polyprenyl-3-methyl-5-hydroxy-6-metoxy-1,4-benzoquinol methylase